MNGEIIVKFDLKAISIALVIGLLGVASVKTIEKAKASTTLSGQYGCITNKNFGGFNVVDTNNSNTTDITGSNYMLYFNFDTGVAAISVVGSHAFNTSNTKTTEVQATGTVISTIGPITGSYEAIFTPPSGGGGPVIFYLMSVNSGNTLLLQESTTSSNDGEPNTGVCNKV